METTITPRSQMSVAFRYAIMSSLITIMYSIILYLLNVETNKGLQWVSYLILIIFMFIGIKDYRDKDLIGYISFGKAMSTGLLIAFFTGIICSVFSYVFISYIDTGLIKSVLQQTEQNMIEKGMSQEQIDRGMKYTRMIMTPIWISVFSVLWYAFLGLIISLIESAILKKDNPEMPQA